jgi:hypothetical protein
VPMGTNHQIGKNDGIQETGEVLSIVCLAQSQGDRPMDLHEEALDHEAAPNSEMDEVEEVLASLRQLMARTGSPVVRACLEEAHDDIIHLTGSESKPAGVADESDAA